MDREHNIQLSLNSYWFGSANFEFSSSVKLPSRILIHPIFAQYKNHPITALVLASLDHKFNGKSTFSLDLLLSQLLI
jgi:hypothetical protein